MDTTMDNILLSGLKKGKKAVIKGYTSDDIVSRICDIGLLPGTMVEVTNTIPFDGPICLCLDKNRCKIAIGKKEASCILIDLI